MYGKPVAAAAPQTENKSEGDSGGGSARSSRLFCVGKKQCRDRRLDDTFETEE